MDTGDVRFKTRGEEVIIAYGETVLKEGDVVTALTYLNAVGSLRQVLEGDS